MNKKFYTSEQCNVTHSEIITPIREQMACSEFARENAPFLKESVDTNILRNSYNFMKEYMVNYSLENK